jgi:flagellar motility protein MotE (MotC chaperone)
MYEERNKKDLEVIEEHQKKIEERNKKIEEEREKIVDVYRSIEASKYVS